MTSIDRRTFGRGVLGAGFGALLLGAAGCTGEGSTTTGGSGTKTLTLASDAAFTGFDPAKQVSSSTRVLLWQAVFDTLLRLEPDGSIVPNAAESFTFNDAKTEMTLKIRPGMRFTDGTAVDAEAVKASLEYMKNGGGSDSGRLADVQVAVEDVGTVVLTTPEAKGLLPIFLCLSTGILSSPASHKAAGRDTEPVGSGPYRLDAAATTSGATYTFVRNEDYWNKDAFPYDKVVVRQMPDITARVNALKTGQISGTPLTIQTYAEAERSGLNVLRNSVNWAGLMMLDQQGKVIPALGEVKVRRAVNMVFDRPAILKALFQGQGKVTNQIFNEKSDAYLADMVDHYPFDVEKARSLMAEAGYADGFSFTLPAYSGMDFANPLIVQQLALLNIRAEEMKVPADKTVATLVTGRYPIFFWMMESRTALWDIVQSLPSTAVWNPNRTVDPALAPLLEKAQRLDGAEAEANAQAINRFLIEEAWYCPWTLPASFYATDGKTSAEPFLGSAVPYLSGFRPA